MTLSTSLDVVVSNYFVAHYGYQPRPFELLKAAEELPKFRVYSNFLSSVVSRDGSVKMSWNSRHSSHNSEPQFDPHQAFVVYVRTTSAAKDNRDPFISAFLLGVNLPNLFMTSKDGKGDTLLACSGSLEQELAQEFEKYNMLLQRARGLVPSFLGTYELKLWKGTKHRPFLEKAAEHLELGIQNGYTTPENLSHAAEALYRLGLVVLTNMRMPYQERLTAAKDLLSRAESYSNNSIKMGRTRLEDFTSAAQIYLQLIRVDYLAGMPLQQQASNVQNFFSYFNMATEALQSRYVSITAHTLEHLLDDLQEILSREASGKRQPDVNKLVAQLRVSARQLLTIINRHKRVRQGQGRKLDHIV